MNKSSITYNKSRCKCIHVSQFPISKIGPWHSFYYWFLRFEQLLLCCPSSKKNKHFLGQYLGTSLSTVKNLFLPPLLLKLSIFMIPCVLDSLLVSIISMLFSSFFMLPRTWLFLALFNRQWNLHSHCPESLTDVSLYQQSSSCHPVSEKPRNLLVSFHLGRYHSDKQITFPNSQKNLCMWSVHCHSPFRNLSSFWCFYHQG